MKSMNKEDIEGRIDRIETMLFLLDMKDTWHTRDYQEDTNLRNELSELRRQLKNLENESEEN
jgi:hypothetical protein